MPVPNALDQAGLVCCLLVEDLEAGHSDNDPVAQWDDRSAEANHATQTVADEKPIFHAAGSVSFDGWPGLRFPATGILAGQSLNLPDIFNGFDAGDGVHVFIVCKRDVDTPATSTGSGFWKLGTDSSGDENNHYPFTDGAIYDDALSTARKSTGNPSQDLAARHTYSVHSATNDWESKHNGTSHFSTATNTVACDTTPALGASADVFFEGYFFAFVAYLGKRTSGEETAIINYLAKYQTTRVDDPDQAAITEGAVASDSFVPSVTTFAAVSQGAKASDTFTPATATPADPTNLVAVGGIRQIVLTWDDNASDETGYRVYASSTGPSSGFALIATLLPDTETYTHSPVSPSVVWWYYVEAFNAAGASNSNIASASALSASPFCALRVRYFADVSVDPDSRVEVPGVPVATGAFTAMAWVAWESVNSDGHILGKFGNWFLHADTQVTGAVWTSTGGSNATTGGHVTNEDYGVAFVFNGTTLTVYLYDPDTGVITSASAALSGTLQTTLDNVFVIANHYLGGWNHNGYEWDAQLFDEALTEAQLRRAWDEPITNNPLGTPLVALPLGEDPASEPNLGSQGSNGSVIGLVALGIRPHRQSGYITTLFVIAYVGPVSVPGDLFDVLTGMGHTLTRLDPATVVAGDFTAFDQIVAVGIPAADAASAAAAIMASGKPVFWGAPKGSPSVEAAHTDVAIVHAGLVSAVDTVDGDGSLIELESIAHPMLVSPATAAEPWRGGPSFIAGNAKLTFPTATAQVIGTVIATNLSTGREQLVAIDAGTPLIGGGTTAAPMVWDASLTDGQHGDQFGHQFWMQRALEFNMGISSLLTCAGQPCHVHLQIYEDDRTTVLIDFSTDPLHIRPFLCLPENYGEQEIDIVAGAATIGQVSFMVVDRRMIEGDQDSGIFTDILPEIIAGRRCRMRRFTSVGWVTLQDGPASAIWMDASFSAFGGVIRDTRESERQTRAFANGGTTTVWPQGILNDFGTVATAVAPNEGRYKTAATGGLEIDMTFSPEYTGGLPPTVTARLVITTEDLERMKPDAAVLPGFTAPEWYEAPEHAFYVRQDSSSAWQLLNPIGTDIRLIVRDAELAGSSPVEDVLFIQQIKIPSGVTISLTLNSDVEVVIVSRGPASEYAPVHISGLTSGQFLKNGYDGIYSPPDLNGDVVPSGVRYDAAALAQMTDPVVLRITEPWEDFRADAETFIYAPTGWVPALDNDGAISPVSQIPPVIDFDTLINIDDAITEPVPNWNSGERFINRITFTYQRLFQPPNSVDVTSRDRIMVREIIVEYLDPESIDHHRHEYTVDFDGSAFSAAGDQMGAATEDPEAGAVLAADRNQYLIPRYKDGAQTIDVPVMREFTEQLRAGDWCRASPSWFPNYFTRRRGMEMKGQIMAIRDLDCAWRQLLIEEIGPTLFESWDLEEYVGVVDTLDITVINPVELEEYVGVVDELSVALHTVTLAHLGYEADPTECDGGSGPRARPEFRATVNMAGLWAGLTFELRFYELTEGTTEASVDDVIDATNSQADGAEYDMTANFFQSGGPDDRIFGVVVTIYDGAAVLEQITSNQVNINGLGTCTP